MGKVLIVASCVTWGYASMRIADADRGPETARKRGPPAMLELMPDLHAQTAAAIATVLAENGAAAPNVDTDTLAGLIATAVVNTAKEHAASTADPDAELAAAEVPTPPDPTTPA